MITKDNINEKFGSIVLVDKKLDRLSAGRTSNGTLKSWFSRDIPEAEGILIGVRYLRNGYSYYWEDHIEWNPVGETIPAFLVVLNPHHNHIYVPVDGIREIGE